LRVALFALDVLGHRALVGGGHDVAVHGLLLPEAPAAPHGLVELLVGIGEAEEDDIRQCCQFMPKPAIDGLVTRTDSPLVKPSILLLFLRWIGAGRFDGVGDEFRG
jgi:hypothetical protein